MRSIPASTAEFVAQFEGFVDTCYLDQVDVPTIGYGHTDGLTRDDVGNKRCTHAEAIDWLREDLAIAQTRLYSCLADADIQALTEHQYSALLSFVFNLGASADWGLWQYIRDKDYTRVPVQLMRFNHAGGRVVAGLTRRRQAEGDLWQRG